MKTYIAFSKKEGLDLFRTGKLYILGLLFCLFGIMNPAIAKLTPLLMELLSDSLAESGMTVTSVSIDALTSWTQFFKNMPIALIAFVCVFSNSFTKEYETGTLLLVLSKGVPRHTVYISKATVQMLVWTAGYWLSFGITYGYNAFYWENAVAVGLIPTVVSFWVFGLWILSLLCFFSVVGNSQMGVLLGTGGMVLLCYILSLIPTVAPYLPVALSDSANMTQAFDSTAYFKPYIATAVSGLGLLIGGIPAFNQKQL